MMVFVSCSQKYQLASSDIDNFDNANLSDEKKLEIFAIKQFLFDGLLRSCSRSKMIYADNIELCINKLAQKERLELIQQNKIKNNGLFQNLTSKSNISLKNEDLLILLLGDISAGNLEGLSSLPNEAETNRKNQVRYMQSRQNQYMESIQNKQNYLKQLRELEKQNLKTRKED
ncbi:hypothetical protein OAI66_01505 [Gammaproteobacteria bacterium]|nr:hypothetical protein [Gammaproteobacteria bacterium]